jgi:hypothetical protein
LKIEKAKNGKQLMLDASSIQLSYSNPIGSEAGLEPATKRVEDEVLLTYGISQYLWK